MSLRKAQNYPHHRPPKIQNAANEIKSLVRTLSHFVYTLIFNNNIINEF